MSAVITGDQTSTTGLINSKTAVASTSGTSIDFTSIPAGVKRITVMFSGVSTNGTSIMQVQIGSGSVTSSGYSSNTGAFSGTNTTGLTSASSGFLLQISTTAASTFTGSAVLFNITGNTWVFSSNGYLAGAANWELGAGSIALGGALDRVRITTVNGTDTFDAGSINILYE